MMPVKNLYGILGLSQGADEQAIKSAYRQLAKVLHPDHNPDDPSAAERFKEIVAAYYVLSDPVRRAAYLHENGFESILENARRRSDGPSKPVAPQDGQDISVRLHLGLEEIASGATKKVKIRRQCNCAACHGSGFEGCQTDGVCPACHGTGSVPDLIRLRRGLKGATLRCRTCDGTRSVRNRSCPTCVGRGRIMQEHYLTLSIPAGVEEHYQMVIKGQGHEGLGGGMAGDIKVVIHQKPHAYFERRGSDLIYHCPLSLSQWLQGAELRIPSLNGEVRLKISPGMKSEGTLRVPLHGLPGIQGTCGDLLVQYRLLLPHRLSRKQLATLKRLEELPGFAPVRDERGFFPREF